MGVRINTLLQALGFPPLSGLVTLQGSGSTTITQSGSTITVSSTGGGGGSLTITEVEVDFGTKPVYDAVFTITDGTVTAASKILISESGKIATGRTSGDSAWDSIACAALPGSGSFQVFCKANPGPVVGKRKLQYTVG